MRKRLSNLWPVLVSYPHLYQAYLKARRGKRNKVAVQTFSLDLEGELSRLKHELSTYTYRPGGYRLFTLYERKPRQIAAAPFRDRVVHHAIMALIEPAIDRSFIDQSFACRAGKGNHLAVQTYQQWARRYRYVLQMDIQQYFPSIDRDRLKGLLRDYIKDPSLLWLLDRVIDNSPDDARARPGQGIPIGNLTSQFFANLYLNRFDHAVKQCLKAPAYGRYVDDMVLLSNDKPWLHDARDWCREALAREGLVLHPHKCHISPVSRGIDYLGYHVWPEQRRLRNDNGHRFARKHRHRARLYARGQVSLEQVGMHVNSWVGHARHADSHALRKKLLGATLFVRGS